MQKKRIVIIILIVLLIVGLGIGVYIHIRRVNRAPIEVDKRFENVNLEGVTKVMFIAHPDDDMIWGGAHLLEDGEKYLVVCVTCGTRKDRAEEFEKVMARTNSKYFMLGWPDKTKGEKDKWETSKEGIQEDFKRILSLKDWDLIVTHNPEGEYGHIHHIMTSEMITNLADTSKLMYFARYYKKTELKDHVDDLEELDADVLEEKREIIGIYKTQSFVFRMFGHMYPYEDWVSYEDWNNEG